MKTVSIVCELGMRYKYPQPLDIAEILAAKSASNVILHGRDESDVINWNSARGFEIDLSIPASSGTIKTLTAFINRLLLTSPSVVICFSPLSLLAASVFKVFQAINGKTICLAYYSLELEKPSIFLQAGGRLAWLLFLLSLNKTKVFVTGSARAKVLRKWFFLPQEPVSILNCALLRQGSLDSNIDPAHQAIDLAGDQPSLPDPIVSIVCAGGLSRLNCIYEILDSLSYLPDHFILHLVGPITSALIDELNHDYHIPFSAGRIVYHGEVHGSRDCLVDFLARFSIGIALKNPMYSKNNMNDILYTPNKVFDYVAAGLPSLVTANPDTSFLAEVGCSSILDQNNHTPQEIAKALKDISKDIIGFRSRTRHAFMDTLNYDFQSSPLISFVNSTMGSSDVP
jgi:hypothetical protein